MSQRLDEQIMTIERALGERMIEHALVVVRSWLNELGENNPYEEAAQRIRKDYNELFNEWLSIGNEDTDMRLNRLTGDMYQLVDAVYASIRVYRGLSPEMHGFNPDLPQSVMNYFASNVRLRPEDYEWMIHAAHDSSKAGTAIMAVGALSRNMRECFNLDALLAMIECIDAENALVGDQCLAGVFQLLIQYDIRIDFFEQLQRAFLDALNEMGDEGEHAFEVLCAMIQMVRPQTITDSEDDMSHSLPNELKHLLQHSGLNDLHNLTTILPKSELEYMQGLVELLPDTWLYDVLVAENEEREQSLARLYLALGRMDLMWENIDEAIRWLVDRLRGDNANIHDYINYAHCLLLSGDRMMAFEYYRQARQLCNTPKDFFNLFRPDRRALVDHGIPLEQIYLIEDRMLENKG